MAPWTPYISVLVKANDLVKFPRISKNLVTKINLRSRGQGYVSKEPYRFSLLLNLTKNENILRHPEKETIKHAYPN